MIPNIASDLFWPSDQGNQNPPTQRDFLTNKFFKTMKKLKVWILGASIFGMTAFGASYFGASEAEAQGGPIMNCDWDGSFCKKPIDKTPCGCEDPTDT